MNARYKHDDPTHLEFGRSADSKLLVKSRGRGYAMGGTIWPDETSPFAESLPISGGSANLPGGTLQTGGTGVYDPKHPERGAQGASEFNPEGSIGEMGHTRFAPQGTHEFKYKVDEGD